MFQVDFEGFLHAQICNCHWVIYAFLALSQLATLFDLSYQFAALFGKENADGQKFCHANILVLYHFLLFDHFYFYFGVSPLLV